MCKDLLRFDIAQRKSLTSTFPSNLASHPLIHHFMRGYFDGDGCIYFRKSDKSQLRFHLNGTETFLKEYASLLGKPNKKLYKPSEIYSLSFGGNNLCRNIYQYLYDDATVMLDRKYQKYLDSQSADRIKHQTWFKNSLADLIDKETEDDE
jgi:hypothetical protein